MAATETGSAAWSSPRPGGGSTVSVVVAMAIVVADMVGVHDDADKAEFSRYARVRGRNEASVISVEWLRRSPTGRLVPPRDIGPNPLLVPPSDRANQTLADAAHVRLVRILTVSTGGMPIGRTTEVFAARAMPAPPMTEIPASDLTINANVSVTYEIAP